MTSYDYTIMADQDENTRKRQKWHSLLMGLKSTVEGLLAVQTQNVWSTYGGLNRVCGCMEDILNHGLQVVVGTRGSVLDYLEFVKSLRWMNPVLAPSIDQLRRPVCGEDGLTLGQIWLRRSVLNHTLSMQLSLLTSDPEHLADHYTDDAFLRQKDYVRALLICLQAVEKNQPALLTDIHPALLNIPRSPARRTHVRSNSLPINHLHDRQTETDDMRSKRDPLAPLFASPKSESILTTSDEHAKPCIADSDCDDHRSSAKEALKQVLGKSGETIDPDTIQKLNNINNNQITTDPLMNMQVMIQSDYLTGSGKFLPGFSALEKDRARLHRNRHSRRSSDVLDSILDKTAESRRSSVARRRPRKSSMGDICVREFYHRTVDDCEPLVPVEDCDEEDEEGEITRSHDSGVSTLGLVSTCLRDQSTQTKVHPSGSSNRGNTAVKKSHVRSVSDFGIASAYKRTNDVSASSSQLLFTDETDDPLIKDQSSLSTSLPSVPYFSHKDQSNLGHSNFPQPSEGQSLRSFLSSQDFHTCAELDKENAHFSICETLISAIEQMKWNKVTQPECGSDGDSDEEIQNLKQRIRIRRRERLREKANECPSLSDGRTASTSSDDIQDKELELLDEGGKAGGEVSNLTRLQENGLSLSMASLYSDADIRKSLSSERQNSVTENETSTMSAESVAISLIKQFSENQLPKASDLVWLVSEQDAPQALLPLPNSYPVSPDEGENADLTNSNKRVRMRGNLEWAPPRAQIIFSIHPPPKRKSVIAKQNYLCAGCGTKVEPGFMKRFRYCEYTGKYFCLRCHTNTLDYIPGRILRKGDFTKYYVSNFAHDLLIKMYDAPLFNVMDINPVLYRKMRSLDTIREYRLQLFHLQSFLRTCRNGQSMQAELDRHPAHWFSDIHMYSMAELVQVKKGELIAVMRSLVNDSVTHITQCQLCQAKGFICELCNNSSEIIFPFELNKVTQCTECRSCFHKTCPMPDQCPKCARIKFRRDQLANSQIRNSEIEH